MTLLSCRGKSIQCQAWEGHKHTWDERTGWREITAVQFRKDPR